MAFYSFAQKGSQHVAQVEQMELPVKGSCGGKMRQANTRSAGRFDLEIQHGPIAIGGAEVARQLRGHVGKFTPSVG